MSEEQAEYIVNGRPAKMPFECEVCGGKHPTLQQARSSANKALPIERTETMKTRYKDTEDVKQAVQINIYGPEADL